MTAVADLDLPVFDHAAPDLYDLRLHEALAELTEQNWLAFSNGGYFVLEREAAEHFLRSKSVIFPGLQMTELFGITDGPVYEQSRRNIINVNGPDHSRLRGLVNPAFTPRAADRHRPAIREQLEALWEPLADQTTADVVPTLCDPFPARVIATVMGAPVADADRLDDWSNRIQKQFSPNLMEDAPDIADAVVSFYHWARELLAKRRDDPGEDLLSQLIAAEEEGDRLSEEEVIDLTLAVLVGGVDTTQSQLAHTLRLMAGHPEQWALLAERPELAKNAVQESLRFEPITPFTARMAIEDISYRGVEFPKGTLLWIAAITANRDEDAYESPHAFDITIERDARPLTFGAGVHHCLGANLARAELEEALQFLPPRMPGLALDGKPEFESFIGIYGLSSLPLRWDQA